MSFGTHPPFFSKNAFFSSKILGFKLPYTEKTINKACEQIIKKQNIKNGYLRPFAWRGSEMMAISAQNTTIHVAIATWEMTTYFDKRKKFNGIKLQTSKWMRPQSNTAPTQAKAAGLYIEQKIIRTGKLDDLSEEELEKRMKEIIDQYAPILEGKIDVADVKKKQKQLRLNGKLKSQPLRPLKKINEESKSENKERR